MMGEGEGEGESAPARPAPVSEPSMLQTRPARRARTRFGQRCIEEGPVCYHSPAARLMLAGVGFAITGASLMALFGGGDRQGLGDPWPALSGVGTVAMGAATIGGIASVVGLDGPTVVDRITPATVAVGVGLGGTGIVDERAPYSMSGSIAPTLAFPHDHGRLRLVASAGGDLGSTLERDPRPQSAEPSGFVPGLSRKRVRVEGGLDLAVRLPYPAQQHKRYFGRLELRYKPLVFFAREQLDFASDLDADGTSESPGAISQRLALTPLNVGLRWNVSPRERFTVYVGPRWDFNGYGDPGEVAMGRANVAPLYAEAWFDIDLRIHELRDDRRARVVGQFTVGYVHSRFDGLGLNVGAIVGFLGPVVTQFVLRVRPRASKIAYQFTLGARAGAGLHPYLRAGIVLPDLGARR